MYFIFIALSYMNYYHTCNTTFCCIMIILKRKKIQLILLSFNDTDTIKSIKCINIVLKLKLHVKQKQGTWNIFLKIF